MSAPASPAPAAPIRVAAGTTAGAAVRDAGLPSRGAADAIVVVRDADGRLRDLSWTPDRPGSNHKTLKVLKTFRVYIKSRRFPCTKLTPAANYAPPTSARR